MLLKVFKEAVRWNCTTCKLSKTNAYHTELGQIWSVGKEYNEGISSVKNWGRFLRLLKSVKLDTLDNLVSLDVVSVCTDVPGDEALQAIMIALWRNGLAKPLWNRLKFV
jgi:hypothetical protein